MTLPGGLLDRRSHAATYLHRLPVDRATRFDEVHRYRMSSPFRASCHILMSTTVRLSSADFFNHCPPNRGSTNGIACKKNRTAAGGSDIAQEEGKVFSTTTQQGVVRCFRRESGWQCPSVAFLIGEGCVGSFERFITLFVAHSVPQSCSCLGQSGE